MIRVDFEKKCSVAERREALSLYVGYRLSVKASGQRVRVEGTLASLTRVAMTLTTAGGMPMQCRLANIADVQVDIGGTSPAKGERLIEVRTKTVLIRMTPHEKSVLTRHATSRGVSLSGLLRDCALADAGGVP